MWYTYTVQNRFERAPQPEPAERFRGLMESVTSLADSLWRNQVGDRAANQVLARHANYEAVLAQLDRAVPPVPYRPPAEVRYTAQDMFGQTPEQLGRLELDQVLQACMQVRRVYRLDAMTTPELKAAEQARIGIEDQMTERFGTVALTDKAFTIRNLSTDGLVLKGRFDEQIVDLAIATNPRQPLVQCGIRDTYDTYLPQQPVAHLEQHFSRPETTDLLLGDINQRLTNVQDGLIWTDDYRWP